jgi:hypothetical protein
MLVSALPPASIPLTHGDEGDGRQISPEFTRFANIPCSTQHSQPAVKKPTPDHDEDAQF